MWMLGTGWLMCSRVLSPVVCFLGDPVEAYRLSLGQDARVRNSHSIYVKTNPPEGFEAGRKKLEYLFTLTLQIGKPEAVGVLQPQLSAHALGKSFLL